MILQMLLVAFAAVLINLPFGIWRAHYARFSWQWFAAVHVSVPLVILVRIAAGLDWSAAPLALAGAVVGQVVGGWIGRGVPSFCRCFPRRRSVIPAKAGIQASPHE